MSMATAGPTRVNENGANPQLVWLHAPDWKRHVIAPGVDKRDILAVTLLGHRGVLVVHKQMQVRFYEIPAQPTAPWPAQDLYSFYTPSREGGLGMADIDGDGLPDILCGNDWIQSPKRFDLHWRLFAINTWNELENSAMLRLAYRDGILVAGQREMTPARLSWFEKPAGGSHDAVAPACDRGRVGPHPLGGAGRFRRRRQARPAGGRRPRRHDPARDHRREEQDCERTVGARLRRRYQCGREAGRRAGAADFFRGGGTRRRVDRELHHSIFHLVIRFIGQLYARHELHDVSGRAIRADQRQRILHRCPHVVV